MQIKHIALFTCVVAGYIPAMCFAFFCPTNFNQIEPGDTIDKVTQVCGKPDKLTERKVV